MLHGVISRSIDLSPGRSCIAEFQEKVGFCEILTLFGYKF